jgi:hypothetical protein
MVVKRHFQNNALNGFPDIPGFPDFPDRSDKWWGLQSWRLRESLSFHEWGGFQLLITKNEENLKKSELLFAYLSRNSYLCTQTYEKIGCRVKI